MRRGIVVFPEGAFKQAETGFQRQRRPTVHTVGAHVCRQVLNGIVDVFQHVPHNDFAAVTRPVQLFGVGLQLGVNPRDVAEALHHIEIEVGAEEAGQGRVFHHGIGILALVHVLQQGVHLAEIAPGTGSTAPAAAGGRNGSGIAAAHEGGQVQAHQLVALLTVRGFVQQVIVEGVREQLQVGFVAEVVLGRHGGLGSAVQEFVAGGQAKGSCCDCN